MHIHNGEFISRFPLTPGHEFTGYVSEVGKNVEGFAVGDRVVADNTVLCGECEYCRRDMPLFCERFYSLGVNGPGGFAEYVAVNYDKVFHISDLSLIHISIHSCCRRARVRISGRKGTRG